MLRTKEYYNGFVSIHVLAVRSLGTQLVVTVWIQKISRLVDVHILLS
jgi:hypothetical protein